jgi:hypothetical protein
MTGSSCEPPESGGAGSSDLHRRCRKDADYKAAYDALGEEFDLARALIEARAAAGLSQSQLAKKMKTSQSYLRLDRPFALSVGVGHCPSRAERGRKPDR